MFQRVMPSLQRLPRGIPTVIADGQISVPKEMLHALNIQTGDTVDVESLPDGSIRIFPNTLNASEVAAMLKTKSPFHNRRDG
ncbi:MAG: AbrB/MazE/SpoVT family DNA-binding domain-containing protein [Candidatus Hydrogenedentes bacterium]|jgi:AbrB family looped-hinge helix DNA binding protein|nr:AbrB/MazE/SpoVT family DNA-binding domain-containing protein [Candidatus Hydrogenedentota bacterium]